MTAEEYLYQYRRAKAEILARNENIEQIMEMATKVTTTLDGARVQSGVVNDRVCNAAVALAEMCNDAESRINDARALMLSIDNTLSQVTDERYFNVLYHFYVLGKKWEQVAVDVHFEYSWVLDLHKQALVVVADILKLKPKTETANY